jgi:hypothetical protein
MNANWGILVEGLLFGGTALGFGFWQLFSVRREIRKDREKAAAQAQAESAGS